MICPECGKETLGVDHNGRGARCHHCWFLLPRAQPAIDATTRAKTLAKLYGIDLSKIAGTGKDGRILARDVEPT